MKQTTQQDINAIEVVSKNCRIDYKVDRFHRDG